MSRTHVTTCHELKSPEYHQLTNWMTLQMSRTRVTLCNTNSPTEWHFKCHELNSPNYHELESLQFHQLTNWMTLKMHQDVFTNKSYESRMFSRIHTTCHVYIHEYILWVIYVFTNTNYQSCMYSRIHTTSHVCIHEALISDIHHVFVT